MNFPSISIIIVNWNGVELLGKCLSSIFNGQLEGLEVLVVDNGSTDGSLDLLKQHEQLQVLELSNNQGFSVAANLGLRAAKGEIRILVNNDLTLQPKCIKTLAHAFQTDKKLGVAGVKTLFPDGQTIQHVGAELNQYGYPKHLGFGEEDLGQHNQDSIVPFVTGAVFAIRSSLLNEVGFLDEEFSPVYFEDIDFCTRVQKAGYLVKVIPAARAIHEEGRSTDKIGYLKKYAFHKNRLLYQIKHNSANKFSKFVESCELETIASLPTTTEIEALRNVSRTILFRLPYLLETSKRINELPQIEQSLKYIEETTTKRLTHSLNSKTKDEKSVELKLLARGHTVTPPTLKRRSIAWILNPILKNTANRYLGYITGKQNAINQQLVKILEDERLKRQEVETLVDNTMEYIGKLEGRIQQLECQNTTPIKDNSCDNKKQRIIGSAK